MDFLKRSWRQLPAYGYLFFMFSIFLFCFDDYYFNITETKYHAFKISTITLLVCYMFIFLFEVIMHAIWKEKGWLRTCCKQFIRSMNLADAALILFVCLHIGSMYLNSSYAYEIWNGNVARYMGVEFYILILFVYFIISRVIEKIKPVILCLSISVSLVSILATLNFVGIDPFGFYEKLSPKQIPVFLSTIGNINFLSSLICISFPITSFLYMSSTSKGERIFYLLNATLAFVCMVVSSSDSGFLGCGMFFYVSLLFVCKNYYRLYRWMILLTTCLIGTKLIILLISLFPDGYHILDTTSRMLSTGVSSWILILVCVLGLGLLTFLSDWWKHWLPRLPLRFIFILLFTGLVFIFLCLMYYFTVINPNYELGELKNYLRFDMQWGTSRRYIWNRSLEAYSQFSIPQKILGFGPGTLYFAVGSFLKDFSNNYDNAHSEYIQYLVTVGVTGLFTYIVFLFFSLRYAFQKMYRNNIYLLALGLSFLVYIIQASINLNQIFTTPIFFLIASLLRQQTRCMDELKKAYYREQKEKKEAEETPSIVTNQYDRAVQEEYFFSYYKHEEYEE